ncbi:MAG: glycosyltransferase [Knoellia sp.]
MDVSVVTSGHDVSDARLHRLVAACVRAGLEVEVLGLGDSASAPREASRTVTRSRPRMFRRALLAGQYAVAARGSVLLALDPDSLIAALAVGRLRGRKVVADVHEDYAALLADRAWAQGPQGRVAARLVSVATSAATHSDLTFVADDHVPPQSARHRLVVRNAPDLTMLPSVATMAPTAEPRAVYVGDLRRSRGLFAMVDAVAGTNDWHLDLVGPVAQSDQVDLDRRLDEGGLAGRVTLHGQLPPERSWEIARRAWVGLSLLCDTPAFRDAMPTKVTEYLACGLPVVTTDLPRPAALILESGAGAVVPANPEPGIGPAAADVLRGWVSDPSSLARVRAAATQMAQDGLLALSPYDHAAAALADLAAATGRPGGRNTTSPTSPTTTEIP